MEQAKRLGIWDIVRKGSLTSGKLKKRIAQPARAANRP